MAVANSTGVITHAQPTPSLRLVVAGIIGRYAGRTVSIVRTESGTTGTVLPLSAPDAPVFAPIEFHTAETNQPAPTVAVADWAPVDFDVYESFASTARPIPTPVIDAALTRSTNTIAYWLASRQDAEQVAYDVALGSVA